MKEAGPKELALGLGLALAPGFPSNSKLPPVEEMVTRDRREGWKKYEALIESAANKYAVPQDLLKRLLHTENTTGNPMARNPSSGAEGLAQFMPETAKERGVNSYDPESSIHGAAKYLHELHNEFGSWKNAVAAYNAGPGTVKKWLAEGGELPAETIQYLKTIRPTGSIYTDAAGEGGFAFSVTNIESDTKPAVQAIWDQLAPNYRIEALKNSGFEEQTLLGLESKTWIHLPIEVQENLSRIIQFRGTAAE